MSRQVRNRVTATALGGLLLGAALLTTGTANAEQVAGGGRQVVFAGGGVLGRSCSSTPSVESLLVPADGRVLLVNRTGHGARLRLDGKSRGTVPDDGSTEVVFRHGTTAVTLDPTCAVSDPAAPVLVTAAPAPATRPDPMPLPTLMGPDLTEPPALTSEPGTSAEPAHSDSALPTSAATATARPPRSSTTAAEQPATVRPGASRAARVTAPAATRSAQVMPHGGAAAPRVKTRIPVRGTAGAAAPTFSGLPPGDAGTIRRGVPTLDPAAPPTTAAPESPAGSAPGVVAAEPVAAMRPLPDSQPLGLLTVTAMVCVLGVAIGVIRAMVSQRAYRSSVA